MLVIDATALPYVLLLIVLILILLFVLFINSHIHEDDRDFVAEHCDWLNDAFGGDWYYDEPNDEYRDYMTNRVHKVI